MLIKGVGWICHKICSIAHHNWYRYKPICTQKSFHETKGMFQGWTQMIMAGFFAAVRSFGANVASIGNFVLIVKNSNALLASN